MPEGLLNEIINMELGAQEQWPQAIKLYQPYEVEQILLPDNANCLAVQAFLKMCNLNFEVEPKSNAEYMSPSGKVPFIRCGAFLISEFDNIVAFIGSKGISLSEHLNNTEKSDIRAFISLVNNIFVNAELYICWVHEKTLNLVTKPRHGSVYPWPLNHVLNWQKRKQVIKKLNVLGWYKKTLDKVFEEVNLCCMALTQRLEQKFFFGDKPTELDALVYGHVYAMTHMHAYEKFSNILHQYPSLIDHMRRINDCLVNSSKTSLSGSFEVIGSTCTDIPWNSSKSHESLLSLSGDDLFWI